VISIDLDTLAHVVGGTLVAGRLDAVVTGVVIDSRLARPGVAFVALPGERTDGHAHIADAVARGARAVVASRDDDEVRGHAMEREDIGLVVVDDSLAALQQLAAHHRSRLDGIVIGITGSTGKTSTKDFVRAVLETTLRTEATEGNRNNEIGLPLTILDARPDVEALVLEMAMRGAGQIRELCGIARPECGIITNIGVSHVEILGSEEAIALAKAELIECVQAGGRVFLNGDDAWSRRIAERAAGEVTWFGVDEGNDVTARDIEVAVDGCVSFALSAGPVEQPVSLRVPGRHNVYNALSAAALGLYLNLSPAHIAEGLSNAALSAMRMEVFQTASGVTVLNDAYNANPTSMRAALRTLADVQPDDEGRRVAVLGDMAELGSLTELSHFRLGEEVAHLGLDLLVTAGPRARRIAEGALAEGMTANRVRECDDTETASALVSEELQAGDVVLVKASRVMGLERVVERIVSPDA